MAKIKIIRPVVLGGKLHHTKGAVVEVDPKHASVLVRDGWAEKASEDAPVDKTATVNASREPVNPKQEQQKAADE